MAGNLLCLPSTLCRHIGFLFSERLNTLFTSSYKKISGFTRPRVIGFVSDLFFSVLAPSTSYQSRCGYIFFRSEERIFFFRTRCRIRRIRVGGSRIRKKSCGFESIRIRVDGALGDKWHVYFFPAVTWFYRLQMGLFPKLLSLNKFPLRLPTIRKKKSWRWAINSDRRKRKMYYRTFFRVIFISPVMFSKIVFAVGCNYNEECGLVNGAWGMGNWKLEVKNDFSRVLISDYAEFERISVENTKRNSLLSSSQIKMKPISNDSQRVTEKPINAKCLTVKWKIVTWSLKMPLQATERAAFLRPRLQFFTKRTEQPANNKYSVHLN